ncbi:LPXTG cell wall anchor domain-containing protein [Conexibacter arvalis]|uniref:MYXO-CTERM domain-containing protein n=1 Tax=Conexibacter arvalis TaxID=912552 RepID=A0A840IIN8_9ACTN|nr:LPXTG cell wall anchor domain-containing protein [Conexibacter arvalis]MBB4664947.1 MYXO-CTERM domain-containing protein [Conexibacter arvalis]
MSEREPDQSPAGRAAGDEPHDVLAADEFPGPSPDAAIHQQGPVELPEPPDPDAPPHDVLAAEEFAMPAPRHHGNVSLTSPEPPPGPSRAPLLAGLAAALLGAVVVLRRRRRAKRA